MQLGSHQVAMAVAKKGLCTWWGLRAYLEERLSGARTNRGLHPHMVVGNRTSRRQWGARC